MAISFPEGCFIQWGLIICKSNLKKLPREAFKHRLG
jgi:hypothetical protein